MKIQLVALLGVLILSACSTSNEVVSNNFISKRKYKKGFHLNLKDKYPSQNESDLSQKEKISTEEEINATEEAQIEELAYTEENQTIASVNDNIIMDERKNENFQSKNLFSKPSSSENLNNGFKSFASEKVKNKPQKVNLVKAKHEFKAAKMNKKALAANDSDIDILLLVIIAIFIPPLAVFLFEGSWTRRCTINLILTLLFWFPGFIHALIVLLA